MTEKVKVLWLIRGLNIGGAERLLANALPYIDRERFDYSVAYLMPQSAALAPAMEAAGLPVYCLNQPHAVDPRGLINLVRLLRKVRPHILHTHLLIPGILGCVARRMAPIPAVVYTEHNVLQAYHWATLRAHQYTYNWNDATLFVSDAVRQSVETRCRLRSGMLRKTIHNGVDSDAIERERGDRQEVWAEFNVPPEDCLVVNVARFVPMKRHVDLVQAAALALARNPNITFVLVGVGPLKEQMERMAKKLRIDHKVRFAGTRPDAIRITGAADLFVLPSKHEAQGVALLEALSLGIPIVATRAGGVPEVITDGETGYLVDPLRPEMLAQRMLALLNDSHARRRMGERGAALARSEYTLSAMVREVEGVYAGLLEAKGYDVKFGQLATDRSGA